MVFTQMLAFAALAGIPVLTAIYLLRNRFRRFPVSSLMLWAGMRETKEGGPRLDRVRLPLLFFLELLVIALLAMAAAEPHIRTNEAARPLVVILDDSYSMLAGDNDSPRSRGLKAVQEELQRDTRSSIRFLLAGEVPQLLGDATQSTTEAIALLDQWRCQATSADLDQAVQLAAEIGGDRALTLVITDHAPPDDPGKGKLQWWSFGKPDPNIAIVNAALNGGDGRSRALLEIANLSPAAQTATLTLESGKPFAEFEHSLLKLGPRETRRITLELKDDKLALRARLSPDALAIDNQVTLLPNLANPVWVQVKINDPILQPLVEKAVRASPTATMTTTYPDLLITDDESLKPADSNCWVAKLILEKEAEAYVGPYVMDRTHPLTEGLSLSGVVWGAGKTEQLPGQPVIMAGNIPLLSDLEGAAGRHEIHLRLRPDQSTLQGSPSWPILMWNLIQWRATFAAGLNRNNVRLGEDVVLTVTAPLENARRTSPDGTALNIPIHDRRAVVKAEQTGIYEIQAGDNKYSFAANVLFADESDLTSCISNRWGDWLDETSLRLEYRSVSWVLMLLALATLTAHLFLMRRG